MIGIDLNALELPYTLTSNEPGVLATGILEGLATKLVTFNLIRVGEFNGDLTTSTAWVELHKHLVNHYTIEESEVLRAGSTRNAWDMTIRVIVQHVADQLLDSLEFTEPPLQMVVWDGVARRNFARLAVLIYTNEHRKVWPPMLVELWTTAIEWLVSHLLNQERDNRSEREQQQRDNLKHAAASLVVPDWLNKTLTA